MISAIFKLFGLMLVATVIAASILCIMEFWIVFVKYMKGGRQ